MAPMANSPCFVAFETAVGFCGLVWREGVVLGFRLAEPDVAGAVRRRWPGAVEDVPDESIARVIAAVTALLATGAGDLSFIVCDYGSADATMRAILDEVRRIPPGRLATYGEIAARVGDAGLARVVGRAMAMNPIPIIVPCHRVVGRDGALVGFSAHGGVELKRRLLEREGAIDRGFGF